MFQPAKYAHENRALYSELYKLFQFIFFFFAIIFTTVSSYPLHISSAGTVEQWRNLLPNFFNGEQDFLFSYGPLFWLAGQTVVQYSELTYWLSALFISIYSAVFWAMILRLAVNHKFVISLSVVYLIILKGFWLSAVYFTFPLFLLVYLKSTKQDRLLDKKYFLIGLALFSGFLFYVRFFYGMVAILTFASYLFTTRTLHKKFAPIFIFSIAAVVFYLLIGWCVFHNIGSIKNYLIINSQLSFGNSMDMTFDIKMKSKAWWIIGAMLIAFNLSLIKERSPFLLTINGLFLIFLKLGFSRADHYIGYFICPVAIMALVCATGYERRWRLASPFILAMLLLLGSTSIFPNAILLSWFKAPEDFSQPPAQREADAYPQFRLPADMLAQIGNSSIDVYPYQNEYFLANKLNYVHRPSFQNYMTLTPTLDKLNVDFFAGDEAPEYVLWHGNLGCMNKDCAFYDAFDEKYSLNEDPLTAMTIMTHYHRVGEFTDVSNKPVMLMKKNSTPITATATDLATVTLRFGEWIDVPEVKSGVVKFKPDLQFTLLARLQNMLYRGGVLYINYKMATGDTKRYRLNIVNAQSGVWVAPLLDRFPQKGQRVVQIMLETPSKHYFKNEVKAVWQHYPVEGLELYENRYPTFTDKKPDALSESTVYCDASIDIFDTEAFKIRNESKSRVRSAGWTVFSAASKTPADKAWLTATDSSGNRKYLALNTVARPDVAQHFATPQFTNSGFDMVADTSALKGNFIFSLAIASQGKLLQCSNISRALTLH